MVKVRAEEVPPSGAGVKTVTCAVPAVATSVAGMFAVSCVAMIKLVGRGEPFQRTTESLLKALPLTVRTNGESPLLALVGFSDVTTGAGRFGGPKLTIEAMEGTP